MHARLSPNEALANDTLNVRRNLSAHRVEFDLTPNFEFSFNEFVVYAHRDFELGYLNPVNFLFAEEQVQGDLDNKLMALDFKWKIIPGFTSYGTWFFDELDFWKLFSGWWGNKFVFQLGATYYPERNLPSLTLEFTAARPWTYSHLHSVNSYTSGGRILGLKTGPNTATALIGSSWQVNSRIFLNGYLRHIIQADGLGSDAFASYANRGEFETQDHDFLIGNLNRKMEYQIVFNYLLSHNYDLFLSWGDGGEIGLGLNLTW